MNQKSSQLARSARRVCVYAALLILGFSNLAHAKTYNFDELPAGGNFDPDAGQYTSVSVPNGYGNLFWLNFYVYQSSSGIYQFGGYPGGIVSGPNAINSGEQPAALISTVPFELQSAYITSASILSNVVTLISFLGPDVTGVRTYNIDYTPLLITPDLGPATAILFLNEQNQSFAMDDLTINAVPEPLTGLLVLGGFTAMVAAKGARRACAAE